MFRTLKYCNGGNRKPRRSRRIVAARARRNALVRGPVLRIESLEDRCMLSANPMLSIEPGQFFGQGGSPTPFRATWTDIVEQTAIPRSFNYSINWGDSPAIDTGLADRFRTTSPLFAPQISVGDTINGILELNHSYAAAGQYTVTLTLEDEVGGIATQQTQVKVYPVDNGLRFDGNGGLAGAFEGSQFTISLLNTDPLAPPPTIQNISSWTINWGDSIEVISGNPSSATHVYADDDFLDISLPNPGSRFITAAATGSNGTYFSWSGNFVQVHDVLGTASISGAASVAEGDTYTLNLSAFDPGDPIQAWLIVWGDEGPIETPEQLQALLINGNPSSAAHVYADGDAAYDIQAFAVTDTEALFDPLNFPLSVTVNNVDPTADDATILVAENLPNGTILGTVVANDPGDDPLTYSVVGGTGTAALAVNSATGEITLTDTSLLDAETSPTLTLEVLVTDGDGGEDTASITVSVLNLASISGVVFVDVNQNGIFDANEPGISGVVIKLLDQSGNAVLDEFGDPVTAVTNSGGYYLFEDLSPGAYQLSETQPTGVSDGAELLGSLGGTIVANDRMQLTLSGIDAYDYVFAEFGQQLTTGDTAGTGFWQNKHGQKLIAQGGPQLATWLTTTFPNIFGNALVGASGSDVATFYREQLFKQHAKKSGPPKVDAHFMAVALATYFTNSQLAGQVATAYGVHVTDTGIGTKIVNVGTNGAAFGVANGTNRTVMQLLLATNNMTDQPNAIAGVAMIYDMDGNGVINSTEAGLRTMAFDVFSSINAAGGI